MVAVSLIYTVVAALNGSNIIINYTVVVVLSCSSIIINLYSSSTWPGISML